MDLATVSKAWATIQDALPLTTIHDDTQYSSAIETLNALLGEVGNDETHPLYSLMDILGDLVHAYETERLPLPEVPGAEMLRFLMEQHSLRQADLPEVGSQGVISEILAGKRSLNLRQIRLLAARFHVSPAAFI